MPCVFFCLWVDRPGCWALCLNEQLVIVNLQLQVSCIISTGKRGRYKTKRRLGDLEEEEEGELEQKEDELEEDLMTQKVTYWSHCHRGSWARWHGRHSLPREALRKAARRYIHMPLLHRCNAVLLPTVIHLLKTPFPLICIMCSPIESGLLRDQLPTKGSSGL